jgi:Ca2+-binding EF-hand superfamily protein
LDAIEYSEKVVETFDKKGEKKINFLEFCRFMEDLWNVVDQIQVKNCKTKINKAMNVFGDLFKFLDRDEDKKLTPEDMIYGISRIMVRDVDVGEVNIFYFIFFKYNRLKMYSKFMIKRKLVK